MFTNIKPEWATFLTLKVNFYIKTCNKSHYPLLPRRSSGDLPLAFGLTLLPQHNI